MSKEIRVDVNVNYFYYLQASSAQTSSRGPLVDN